MGALILEGNQAQHQQTGFDWPPGQGPVQSFGGRELGGRPREVFLTP